MSEKPARVERGGRRAGAAVVLVLGLVAAVLAVAGRPAVAAAPAPAATGWYVTARRDASGIALLSIRRDDPVARGTVAVLPRDQLHRLRTVLASEQLIGGSRQLPTTLCARVHCEVGVNGDRWVVSGSETGRISGAVVVDGELIATQPRAPEGLAAHLLIDEDGGMDGTISFQLPIEPVLEAEDASLPVDVNRQPKPDYVSMFTARYGTQTMTGPDTAEYILSVLGGDDDQTTLQPASRRTGGGPVPPSSVVVSALGADAIARADAWWSAAEAAGTTTFRSGLGGVRQVIGGSPLLLEDSAYGYPAGDSDGRHPRTVIGWDAGRVFLVEVDGRQTGWSVGLTLAETTGLLRWLGATDALSLDGGTSSSFVGFGGGLASRPPDGGQRAVAAALVITPPEGSIGVPAPARSLDPACPSDRVPRGSFPDVRGGVHAPAIDCMAWWHVTSGTGTGTYDSLSPVRRDQMAAFIARYLFASGVAFPLDPPDAFPDDERSVHESAIDVLAAMGVIGGRSDGTFAPAESVTRGQMATFLARAVPLATGQTLPNTTDYFVDDSGDAHERNINALTEARIAGGVDGGRFEAGQPVRRDQMGSFLARALSAAVEAGATAPPDS